MNVEEGLRTIREKAALPRYLVSSATVNDEPPDATVLAGFSDVCEEIHDLSSAITNSVGAAALDVQLKRRRQIPR